MPYFWFWKTSHVSCSQNVLTASRNFPRRTRFENVRWSWSLIWVPRAPPGYPVVAVCVSFTSFSNAQQFQQSSGNTIFANSLAPVTSGTRSSLTDFKLPFAWRSTSELVFCQAPLEGLRRKISQLKQTVRHSIGLENRQVFPPIFPLTILFGSTIQIISRILVYPILVDPIELVVSSLEEDFREVFHYW